MTSDKVFIFKRNERRAYLVPNETLIMRHPHGFESLKLDFLQFVLRIELAINFDLAKRITVDGMIIG